MSMSTSECCLFKAGMCKSGPYCKYIHSNAGTSCNLADAGFSCPFGHSTTSMLPHYTSSRNVETEGDDYDLYWWQFLGDMSTWEDFDPISIYQVEKAWRENRSSVNLTHGLWAVGFTVFTKGTKLLKNCHTGRSVPVRRLPPFTDSYTKTKPPNPPPGHPDYKKKQNPKNGDEDLDPETIKRKVLEIEAKTTDKFEVYYKNELIVESKTEEPKKEAPKKEAPKKEVPKKEVPKKEVPKKEVPKIEEPKTDTSSDEEDDPYLSDGEKELLAFARKRRKERKRKEEEHYQQQQQQLLQQQREKEEKELKDKAERDARNNSIDSILNDFVLVVPERPVGNTLMSRVATRLAEKKKLKEAKLANQKITKEGAVTQKPPEVPTSNTKPTPEYIVKSCYIITEEKLGNTMVPHSVHLNLTAEQIPVKEKPKEEAEVPNAVKEESQNNPTIKEEKEQLPSINTRNLKDIEIVKDTNGSQSPKITKENVEAEGTGLVKKENQKEMKLKALPHMFYHPHVLPYEDHDQL